MMRGAVVQTIGERVREYALWLFVGAALIRLATGCAGDAFVLEQDAMSPVEQLSAKEDAGSLVVTVDSRVPDACECLIDVRESASAFFDAPSDHHVTGDETAQDGPDDRTDGDSGLHANEASADVVDAGLACDPAYGDASPGGPCCVHVWATPTIGGVLCTVDGSVWCLQTGSPPLCSAMGSRCVTQPQSGVTYCAP